MDAFNDELNRVFRYSMDNVENLLSQLASPEHNQTRWGHPDRTDFRGVVSDALRDAGRDSEADLLADPNQHVIVSNGRVRPGQFTSSPAVSTYFNLIQHLRNWSGAGGGDHPFFTHTIPTYQVSPSGPNTNLNHVHQDSRPYLQRHIEERDGPQPYGTVRVDDPLLRAEEPHNYKPDFLHHSEVGGWLADKVARSMMVHNSDSPDGGFVTTAPNPEANMRRYKELDTQLRNAPYEIVDVNHPTEVAEAERIHKQIRKNK